MNTCVDFFFFFKSRSVTRSSIDDLITGRTIIPPCVPPSEAGVSTLSAKDEQRPLGNES